MSYFYPEMIPEPDYSDSGDDATVPIASNARPVLDRLRDLTEVYVSNVDTKKKTQAKKAPVKQAESTSKVTAPIQQEPKSAIAKKGPPRSASKKQSTNIVSFAKRTKSPERAAKDAAKSPRKAASGDSRQAVTPIFATKTQSPPPDRASGRKSVVFNQSAARKAAATAAGGDAESEARGDHQEFSDKNSSSGESSTSPELSSDEDQLIKPKKPYVPSSEKQKLHKELKFSQKYGKLVPSKTELQLALERYTENKVKRELDAEEKSSLEKILEYQAKKIEMQEVMDKCPAWLDRLQKPPPTWPNPKTEEFYRVHARVVSSNILTQCFLPEDPDSQCECSSLPPCKTLSQSDSDS